MRIWLDKIGVKRRDRPEGWTKPFKRRVKCWCARSLYGVDPRETYDLESTWHMWMYEHLKMFKKEAEPCIDMTEKIFEYEGAKYSQTELIDMMLERLEFALSPAMGYNDYDKEQFDYVHEVEIIWSIVLPAMWW